MIAFHVLDVREMMAHLLLRDSFDHFFLENVSLTTFANVQISGRRNAEWYETEEDETLPRLLFWHEVKPYVFSYIKGKKTPTSFFVTLKLWKEAPKLRMDSQTRQQLLQGQTDYLLHFRFEQGRLLVVTGCSQKEFTIDKIPENTWDIAVKDYMKKLCITYE